MKNYTLLYFLLLLLISSKNALAASSMYRDTIPPVSLEENPKYEADIEEEMEVPTITEIEANNELIRAKDRIRKARNAFIASFPTLGIFYVLALYWLLAALGPAIRARRHYRKFSKNKALIREADTAYRAIWKLVLAHVIAVTLLLYLTNFFTFSDVPDFLLIEISEVGAMAQFAVILAAIADLFVFNIFLPKFWKKKK